MIFNQKIGFSILIAKLVGLKCCQDGQRLSEVCQTDVIHLLLTLPPAREDISVRCRGGGGPLAMGLRQEWQKNNQNLGH